MENQFSQEGRNIDYLARSRKTTGLFWKRSAVKKEPAFTKLNRWSLRLRHRSLKRKRNLSRGRPSSRSWDMLITGRQR